MHASPRLFPVLVLFTLLAGGMALRSAAQGVPPGAAPVQQPLPPLAGTKPMTMSGDLSAQMVSGIDNFLMRSLARAQELRPQFWTRNFSSRDAYEESVRPNRNHLRRIIGATEDRLPVHALEYITDTSVSAKVAETDRFTVYAVRWQVLEGVYGNGLLLQPKDAVTSRVIVLPDADQTPEMLVGIAPGILPAGQAARRLAENGAQVLVVSLIDRQDHWSGTRLANRVTNQPHREWIYRPAFELGHHIIGYEVQKVLGAVDWMAEQSETGGARIGVAGYGEGGLIALYSAALDTRIQGTVVSGYFSNRQNAWQEPIYRNVFNLLTEFGDAELATLIAPRYLLVEHSVSPHIDGPPAPRDGRAGAAPGKWSTPDFVDVQNEIKRAQSLLPEDYGRALIFIYGNEGMTVDAFSPRTLQSLLEALRQDGVTVRGLGRNPVELRAHFVPEFRMQQQVKELENYTQGLLRTAEFARQQFFWNRIKSTNAAEWNVVRQDYREYLWSEVIGRLPPASMPPNPQSRWLKTTPKWNAYEVTLDVWPDVFAWGYLLLPRDIKPGEKRPVVVCQHGLEGIPGDVIDENPQSPAYGYYKAYAARLADQGFIVFAPHNPYRGKDSFRVLQRKANLLGKSLFSVIAAQHERILDWLSAQPNVDPQRIAFYGLSYGGKSAMRLPALLDRYALSICSGDFNEWIWKNTTTSWKGSYVFSGEYEMPEFNLGNTFNYAEMAALIAPRPFMVERGHADGVGLDEWVAYEYAKVRRFYAQLGIEDRTRIEFFSGPHTIHGVGTFEFLHQQLNWPPAK